MIDEIIKIKYLKHVKSRSFRGKKPSKFLITDKDELKNSQNLKLNYY